MALRFDHNTSATTAAQLLSPEIKGKVIVITGASTGTLGGETAMTLSIHNPERLILLGRNEQKAIFVEDESKKLSHGTAINFIHCDMTDLASVKQAAEEVLSITDRIDILINNAGIMAVPYSKTEQGIESQFGVNHVAHFLLTNLLLPRIPTGGRIVNLTSSGYELVNGFDFDDYGFSEGSSYHPWKGYGQSKTANLLFTTELAKRLAPKNIAAFAVHPGVIKDTNLLNNASASLEDAGKLWEQVHPGETRAKDAPKTLQQGSSTTVIAALSPDLASHSGAFLKDGNIAEVRASARDPTAASRLWELSEKLVGQNFSF